MQIKRAIEACNFFSLRNNLNPLYWSGPGLVHKELAYSRFLEKRHSVSGFAKKRVAFLHNVSLDDFKKIVLMILSFYSFLIIYDIRSKHNLLHQLYFVGIGFFLS